MGSGERWYEAAFGSDYRRVYAHRDLESARREVRFLIELGVLGRVLDLCCGFGRHTLALRESGVDAVGLDLSIELLRDARALPGYERFLGQRLVRGDALALPFAARSFDGLVNLFSSFGYFGANGDSRVAREVARVVRPGGTAVFDLMNARQVRASLRPATERTGEGFVLCERRSLEEGGRRVVKEVELRFTDGIVRRWREDVRMYEESEVRGLLDSAGLEVRASYGDFDRSPLGPQSPRMILSVARR